MRSTRLTQQRLGIAMGAILTLLGSLGLYNLLQRGSTPVLHRIQASGVLLVASRRGPSTFHTGAQGPDGFEYALIRQFARDLGVKAQFVFPTTFESMLDITRRGGVHIAATGLGIDASAGTPLRYSRPYHYVTPQLVYRRGERRPRSLQEIEPGALHVLAASPHEQLLTALRENAYPGLTWARHHASGPETLLASLDEGQIALTLADSHLLGLAQRLYQHAAPAMELGEAVPLRWMLPPGYDDSLLSAADAFIERIQQDGRLQRLQARYFGHSGRMNFVETRAFWRNLRDRLPALRGYFEEAGEITGIDWRLLAAIGYQESHWRADAVSPTGVRGIMMLTQSAAKDVGVTDRDDPRQSILGGARYLRLIENRIPERIREPNRLWLTLAGYNVGFGHLEDARILTARDGANPDLWIDVKQRLPLLANQAYYSTLRYGYARGQEPVDYVDNIRNYYDLLVWFTTTRDETTRRRLIASDTRG